MVWTVFQGKWMRREPLKLISGQFLATQHKTTMMCINHTHSFCIFVCVLAVSLMMSETTSCRLAPPPPNLPKTKRDTERGTGTMTARVADTLTATSRSREEMNTRSDYALTNPVTHKGVLFFGRGSEPFSVFLSVSREWKLIQVTDL